MPLTATQAVSRARLTFPEMSATTGLLHLNDEWAELGARYNLMDTELWVALTLDDSEISLAESAGRIQKIHLYTGADISTPLNYQEETDLDLYTPGWRTAGNGVPSSYTLGSEVSGNTGVRTVGIYPKPNASSIAITSASNANPIQVVTATPHGLSDEDAVRCINVVTNTAANVSGYADVVNTTTFNFYSDSDLTTGIAGNGVGTGGHIVAATSSALRIFYTRSSTLVGSDNLPNIGANADLFVTGICRRHAYTVADEKIMQRERFRNQEAIQAFELYRTGQAEGKGVFIKPYHSIPRRVY